MPIGTFLIYDSFDQNFGDYVLMIKGNTVVENYMIHILDKFGGVYITTKKIFHSLTNLVVYYSKNADDLCSKLILPALVFDLDDESLADEVKKEKINEMNGTNFDVKYMLLHHLEFK